MLTACAADRPDQANGAQPLFRAEVGRVAGGVSPGPHAVWYVPRQPVRFVKIGVASWADRPAAGRRLGWITRLFRRGPTADAQARPTATVAADLPLPTPAMVQVTNIATGRMITVRIEDKTRIDGAIVRLPATAAAALGADPDRPLLVRLRYVAPVMAYESRAPLRYALRARSRSPASVPVRLAAVQSAPKPVPAPTVAPAPPKPALDFSLVLRGLQPAPAIGDVALFRVQAGAFASRANARRAADLLGAAGATSIEPLRRGPLILYRVVVAGPQTADQAERLRDRVAQIGFPDAWILRPL